LRLVGSPHWFFFSATTFVLELVPSFGPTAAFLTVCLVTAAGDPDGFVKTAAAFGVVLLLEGHVVMPLVMKGRVQIPPVHLLLLMTIMGEWFGVFGFLMATPTLMVLRTIYQESYLPIMDRQVISNDKIPVQGSKNKSAAA
jgi:predicted PurR-regulated permease PerM